MIKVQEKDLNDALRQSAALERSNEDYRYRLEDLENKHKSLQEHLEESRKKLEEERAFVSHLQKTMNENPGRRPMGGYYQPNTSTHSTLTREGGSQLSTHSHLARSRTALTG